MGRAIRSWASILALLPIPSCTAPPPQEPAGFTYFACDYDVRPASGPYGLMFGDAARLGWVCREVVVPPIPEMPELSREGLAEGPSIRVEEEP